jgi:folate-dependent phosphoribosylglycinamide formyltransferase PurN
MESAFVGRPSPRVIVFSPSPHSLYTVTILELLKVHGFTVQGIVLRKILNWRRLISELRRDGPRLAWKIWRKLVLRQHAYGPRPYQTLPDVMSELGVQSASVPEWARNAGVQVWRCTTLNDRAVQKALLECEPDAVVFSGGGLIREPILQASGVGVINTHLGVLPMYRGMDVVEWPILEGRPDDVGLSVHLMSTGVDEGDMLAKYRAAREHTESIFDLRERLEALSPVACVSATVGLLKGEIRPCPQNPSDGKQYFIMHHRLRRLARLRYGQIRAEEVNRQAPRHRAPTE